MQKSQSMASLLEFNDCGSSTDEEELTDDEAGRDYGSASSRSVSRNRSKSPLRKTRYSFLFSVLRWPVFVSFNFNFKVFVLGVIVLDLVFYSIVRQIVAVIEYIFMSRGKRRLISEMNKAESFSSWKRAAMQLDKYLGMVLIYV